MSRIYWHAQNRTAALSGAERGHLASVARGPASAAWNFDPTSDNTLYRISDLVSWLRPGRTDYLREYVAAAQTARDAHWSAILSKRYGDYDPEPMRRLVQAVDVSMRVEGIPITVAGVDLDTSNVDLNTAVAAGSPPVQLAAKISGWCESHLWVDGPHRKWLADVIDQGLTIGLYRRGLWYVNRALHNERAQDAPDRKWSDLGWGDVLDLLRESDAGPVVLSYSVCDGFPNRGAAGWEPPPMPEGWAPDWADTDEGFAEWERDYPTPADRQAHYLDTAGEQWSDLPGDEQWALALDGLKRDSPWLELTPESLGDQMFHWPVTVYDLLAPDRDERVRAAAEA